MAESTNESLPAGWISGTERRDGLRVALVVRLSAGDPRFGIYRGDTNLCVSCPCCGSPIRAVASGRLICDRFYPLAPDQSVQNMHTLDSPDAPDISQISRS